MPLTKEKKKEKKNCFFKIEKIFTAVFTHSKEFRCGELDCLTWKIKGDKSLNYKNKLYNVFFYHKKKS